jgi:hypothetical protein
MVLLMPCSQLLAMHLSLGFAALQLNEQKSEEEEYLRRKTVFAVAGLLLG